MLNFLPNWFLGCLSLFLLIVNVIFWVSLLFVFSLLKFILPFRFSVRLFDKILLAIAENWITGNTWWMKLTQRTVWDVQGLEQLNYQGWYLIISNHQSWADIFVLQKLLNRRIPLMKFFLKRELIWVPLMGLAWWALDFPFLRRHSAQFLQKHPDQRGKDMETTRRACEKFAHMPTSVMNFLEGTRFTASKNASQNRPYQYLLKPKAGGIALALSALGDKFHSLLNITIVYPDGIPTFWTFLSGKVKKVIVRIHSLDIPPKFLKGDYEGDKAFQQAFQQWVQDLWKEKDEQIAFLMEESKAS